VLASREEGEEKEEMRVTMRSRGRRQTKTTTSLSW
jgi:hypothetical protein